MLIQSKRADIVGPSVYHSTKYCNPGVVQLMLRTESERKSLLFTTVLATYT